jgi:hypothetical protein
MNFQQFLSKIIAILAGRLWSGWISSAVDGCVDVQALHRVPFCSVATRAAQVAQCSSGCDLSLKLDFRVLFTLETDKIDNKTNCNNQEPFIGRLSAWVGVAGCWRLGW